MRSTRIRLYMDGTLADNEVFLVDPDPIVNYQ